MYFRHTVSEYSVTVTTRVYIRFEPQHINECMMMTFRPPWFRHYDALQMLFTYLLTYFVLAGCIRQNILKQRWVDNISIVEKVISTHL